MDYLKARWRGLWEQLGSPPDPSLLDQVVAAYAEPQRYYHTIDHILNSLELFDWHRNEAQEPATLELAIWLHDVIYDPRASNNESRSADCAEYALRAAGLAHHVERVRSLIESTKHNGLVSGADHQLLSNIDLAILGARRDVYDEYAAQVRLEYSWVPYEVYRKKRTEVLQSLTAGLIYYGSSFEGYEQRAHDNVLHEIKHLSI